MKRKTDFGKSAVGPRSRRIRLEPLEDRRLLSASDWQPTSLETIDEYGTALFGSDWETEIAMTAGEIRQHLVDHTWRSMFNDNQSATISAIRDASHYLGADALQAKVDHALEIANLSRIEVRELDWFRDPWIGPATFGDFFNELGDNLSLEDENLIATPMSSGNGVVSISSSASIVEQQGVVWLGVWMNGETTDGFTAEWRTVNGSATGGAYYSGADFVTWSGGAFFPAGSEDEGYTIGVPIEDDLLEEMDETFTIELYNAQGDGSLGNTICTVTIIDNDPRVSIGDASVTEADPADAEPVATFSITLSKSRPYQITVPWGTSNGNPGDPPADYTSDYHAAGGVVTFAPGETSKQVTVNIRNDDAYEPTEYFYVNLGAVSGAVINDGQGQGTINDDDPMPTLSINDVSVEENAGAASLTVTLSGMSGVPVTVEWAANDAWARHPDDYSAAAYSGTLTFQPGTQTATAAIGFTIVDDTLTEASENFRVTLSNPTNASISDGTGIVTIRVNDPVADIDVDSNNDGAINNADDAIETNAPGKIIFWNRDDDDGNGEQDRLDTAPLAAADDDLQRVNLRLVQLGLPQATLNDLRLTLTISQAGTVVRIWDSATKDNEITSATTWTVGQMPSTVFVEGVANGSATLSLTLTQQSTSQTIHSDSVLVTVNYVDLTAYRPQTEGPGYGTPFQRRAVPESAEENPGAYIRRNGDDDDESGVPDRVEFPGPEYWEDDLVEVSFNTSAGALGIDYVLERSTDDIFVWTDSTKTTPILVGDDEVTLTGAASTWWVEWVGAGTGTAQSSLIVRLRDSVSGNFVADDEIVFHPFTSVVIVLGGEFQNNPTDPPDPNHGTFQMAIDLYEEGYDVHMYDEDDVDRAYEEVLNAITNRGVTNVAIMGYSHGAGQTYHLANTLDANRPTIALPFTIAFTSYVDGVRTTNIVPETALPPTTQWHLNIYQHGSFEDGGLHGSSVSGANENIDLEDGIGWELDVTHSTIDDNEEVLDWVKMRFGENVSR